jgi:alanine racemase
VKINRNVQRSTLALIDLRAISHNIAEIRKRIGKERDLMAVVKADGYGHGAVEVSVSALGSGANCLGVALPEEGEQVRKAGIVAPILVLGLIQPGEAYKVIDSGLEQAVCTLELAQALDQEAGKASVKVNVHVKVDTGMGRIGVAPHDALEFVRKLSRFKNLRVTGIFSHFPSADEADKAFTRSQIETFDQIVRQIGDAGLKIPKRHIANSAAILDLPESYFDLVRPGIMIYGLYPSTAVSRSIKLKPAMTLKTKIIYVKKVPAGTPISYGRTFYTERDSVVATLPVGYADGYYRLLSNQGSVQLRGQRVPLTGRVCMDMCMIDVSGIKDVRPGEEVVLFGDDPTVDEIAGKIGTINYEVVCAVGKRVPRIYQ